LKTVPKILFTPIILIFGALASACTTAAPFVYTDSFNVSSDHFREIQKGPWEVIGNTNYRLFFDHEEKIINIIGQGAGTEDSEDTSSFRAKEPDVDWFPGAKGRIKIHSGFLRQYNDVRGVLLDAGHQYMDYAIRVSGFSLGGAWTQIFLLDAVSRWPDRDIQAIFYAPPNPWRRLPKKYQMELKQRTVFVSSMWDFITWMRLIWFYRYGHNITIGKWWRIFPSQHELPQMIRALDEKLIKN